MAQISLNLGTGSSRARDGIEGNTRHVNCFIESLGQEAKTASAIYPVAGYARWDKGQFTGAARGLIDRSSNEIIALLGQSLVSFDTAGAPTVIGALAGTKRVFMARDQQVSPQTAIVDGTGVYYLLQGSALQQINSPNLPAPNSVTYLDGRFIFGIDDGRFYLANLLDGATVLADAFASAESKADGLVRVFAHKGYLYLFGSSSLEIWRDAGLAGNQPYEPVQRDIDVGCMAAHSVAENDNGLFWVDHKGRVVMSRQTAPARISTHSVERSINNLTPDQKAAMWGFTSWFEGHEFYTLVSDAFTWEYDSITGKWHERQSYSLPRWRINAHIWFNNQHIVGDYKTGQLFVLDPQYNDEDGSPLIANIWCPPVSQFPGGVKMHEINLDLITGAGINNSPVDVQFPKVMLRSSDDGGRTWSTERQGDVGAQGQYGARVRWNRLGTSRHKGRIFSFSMSAAVRRGFFSATLRGDPIKP